MYSGPTTQSTKRVTLRSLRKKYAAKDPLTMVTAYDYPSAVHVGPFPSPVTMHIISFDQCMACKLHTLQQCLPQTQQYLLAGSLHTLYLFHVLFCVFSCHSLPPELLAVQAVPCPPG